MNNRTLTLEQFIASIIKQHRNKFNYADGYYFLTSKQVYLFNILFGQRVQSIEKLKVWDDGKFKMSKDGLEKASLYRYGKKLTYPIPCRNKSMALIAVDKNNKKYQKWFNCEGGAILHFTN